MNQSILRLVCHFAHQAIHDKKVKYASIYGVRVPIIKLPNGCRAIRYEDILFSEQDPHKKSLYAMYARRGKEITWGIRKRDWILIDDTGIHIPKQMQLDLNKLQLV